MKKTCIISVLAAFSLLFAGGCGKTDSSDRQSTDSGLSPTAVSSSEIHAGELVTAAEALNNAAAELAELKDYKGLDNLDFSETLDFVPKEAGDMYELTVDDNYGECSNEELYELLLRGINEEFPNSALANDKQNYFFEAEKNSAWMKDDGSGVAYPKIYDGDNLEKLKDGTFGKSDFMMYSTDLNGEKHGADEEYLALYSTFGVIMKHARCRQKAEVNGEDFILDSWRPEYSFNSIAQAPPNDETKYPLDGGEIAINEAVKFCERHFADSALYTRNEAMSLKVFNVKILKIDENTNAYHMFLSNSYNGIPFAAMNFEGAASGFSDGNEYYFISSEALVSTPNELEYCYLNYLDPKVTTVGGKIDKIIPLKKAAEIISDEFTDYVGLKATAVRLEYYRRQTDNSMVYSSRPVWHFTTFNSNDDLVYEIYVDVQNGDLFYFSHVFG